MLCILNILRNSNDIIRWEREKRRKKHQLFFYRSKLKLIWIWFFSHYYCCFTCHEVKSLYKIQFLIGIINKQNWKHTWQKTNALVYEIIMKNTPTRHVQVLYRWELKLLQLNWMQVQHLNCAPFQWSTNNDSMKIQFKRKKQHTHWIRLELMAFLAVMYDGMYFSMVTVNRNYFLAIIVFVDQHTHFFSLLNTSINSNLLRTITPFITHRAGEWLDPDIVFEI